MSIEPTKRGKHNRKTTLNAMIGSELNDMICKKSLHAYDFYNSFEMTWEVNAPSVVRVLRPAKATRQTSTYQALCLDSITSLRLSPSTYPAALDIR